jgi:hypothetical protein
VFGPYGRFSCPVQLKMSWKVYQELRHTDIARLGELVDQLNTGQPDSAAGGDRPDAEGSEATADAAQDSQPAAASDQPDREQGGGQAALDSVRTRSKESSCSTSTHGSRQSGGSKDDGGWALHWTLPMPT